MLRLYIPVGIPGCGKSTLADRFFSGAVVHSTDKIRDMLSDINDQTHNQEVFERFHELMTADLHAGYDVFADATNLRDYARAKLRDIADQEGAETHLLVFHNVSQSVMRNKNRDRVVPAEVMVKMLDQYQQAMQDINQETYTSITCIEDLQ